MTDRDQLPRFSRASLPRVILACLAGALFPLPARGALYIAEETGLLHWLCPSDGLECLAPALLIALVGGSLVTWLILRLVNVRPAGYVLLLGLAVNAAIQALAAQWIPGGPTALTLSVSTAASLAIAALIIRPKTQPPNNT